MHCFFYKPHSQSPRLYLLSRILDERVIEKKTTSQCSSPVGAGLKIQTKHPFRLLYAFMFHQLRIRYQNAQNAKPTNVTRGCRTMLLLVFIVSFLVFCFLYTLDIAWNEVAYSTTLSPAPETC